MSRTLIFETHATSTDNERGVASGWLPGQLSARGREQAAALGRRHQHQPPAVVFSSDLARAVETAQIAFGQSGASIRLDARLRECNYGRLNGAPAAQLAALRRQHVEAPFPEGESYRQVVQRVAAFLADLQREPTAGLLVVVIGHSATRWSLEHLLLGTPLDELVVAAQSWQPGWRYRLD